MNSITTLWGREPAMVAALIQAGLVLVMAFGLTMSVEQIAAIMAFVNILLGVITRQSVVPTASLKITK